MERKYSKALIEWDNNPNQFPVNEWLKDLVMNFGIIDGKVFSGDTWTVLVRITEFIDDTWHTYADVAFIVDEAPWQLLINGYSFKLWHGREVATVRIL